MKLHLCKQYGQLIPATEQDRELIEKVSQGEVIYAEFKKMRNGRHHRKYFALLNKVFENQEKYGTFEEFRATVTVMAGHCDVVYAGDVEIRIPRTISFAKMDQREFEIFYNNAINAMLKMLPHLGMEDIDSMVNQLVSA